MTLEELREELRTAYYTHSLLSIVEGLQQNGGANWKLILDKVASGDRDRITGVALYVIPGAEEAAAREYLAATALALPKNPEAVLVLKNFPASGSLYHICSLPFIEPEDEFIISYAKRTLAALRRVDDPELRESRDTCMRHLQETLAG